MIGISNTNHHNQKTFAALTRYIFKNKIANNDSSEKYTDLKKIIIVTHD